MFPLLFACLLGLGHGSGACALVDRRNSVDATVCIGQVADLGFSAKAPAAHHFVVKLGPHLRTILNCVFACQAKCAFGSAAPTALLLNIEENEVCVGIVDVIAVLVVNGSDIASEPIAQTLCKGPCQGFSLLM
jgi:hypothetical protein